eukprot:CAMPEP_0182445754 /NCGR_PEP_ID=MMETSP1172-20130603/3771_1 /TAXON_ID=708627 /ORGANISM="Timspurckia oligopyrenoides, Strain CCMP3278" /LENGTH=626 /DNA_ID=CAMNT_0024641577 /DNA_START=239 /DNA_END=2119 /DNA_ORIENTATION=-
MVTDTLRVRRSIRELQADYDRGNREGASQSEQKLKKPLENLVRAWKIIQELDPSDQRSLFALGGYHGEPFEYRPAVDALSPTDTYTYWGGYCHHGNVLFPTWHRVYMLKVEQALQNALKEFDPDAELTLPFWDETDSKTKSEGIPQILTQEFFVLDRIDPENPLRQVEIKNPLRSFTLPLALNDNISGGQLYAKPQGYETTRYPQSGLVGTAEAKQISEKHNRKYSDPDENIQLLNQNVVAWLKGTGLPNPKDPYPSHAGGDGPTPSDKNPEGYGVGWMFEECLRAPNYTVFSNTTSAAQWNLSHPAENMVVSLEQPHNDIHLSVGGFDGTVMEPTQDQHVIGQIEGANGDMGENNTAALDPIFYFHHCNIDRVFWLWQKQNNATKRLEIITNYYGTSSSDSQGPTPGLAPGTSLDLDTPLLPFLKDTFGDPFTSRDCTDIEEQLGYTYEAGSLDKPAVSALAKSSTRLIVRGIDRALFEGSFVIRAFAVFKDESNELATKYLGHHSVLSRRNVIKCANCLTHLEVIAHFSLQSIPEDRVESYNIMVHHRGTLQQLKEKVDLETQTPINALTAPRFPSRLPEKLRCITEVSKDISKGSTTTSVARETLRLDSGSKSGIKRRKTLFK